MLTHYYYFNDTDCDVTIRVLDTRYNPTTATGDIYYSVPRSTGRLFDVMMPPDTTLYSKHWRNMVLLTYIGASALGDLYLPEPAPQPQSPQEGESS